MLFCRHSKTIARQVQRQSSQLGARSLSVVHGDFKRVPNQVQQFVEDNAAILQPDNVHICDGSQAEYNALLHILQQAGMIKRLPKYDNW